MSLYFGRQRCYAPVRAEADRDDRLGQAELCKAVLGGPGNRRGSVHLGEDR